MSELDEETLKYAVYLLYTRHGTCIIQLHFISHTVMLVFFPLITDAEPDAQTGCVTCQKFQNIWSVDQGLVLVGLTLKPILLERRENIYVCRRYNNKQDKRRAEEDMEYATYLLASNLNTFIDISFSWVNLVCHKPCIYYRDKYDSLELNSFLGEWDSCPQIVWHELILQCR